MSEETKEVALSTPKITNTVDLHLNQNDLIDIAIQEKLAVLQVQLKETEDDIMKNAQEQVDLRTKLNDQMAEKIKKSDKGYAKFLALVKEFDIKDATEYKSDNYRYHNSVNHDIGLYPAVDMQSVEDSKDPIRALPRNKRENMLRLQVPTQIYLDAQATDKTGFSLSYNGKFVEISKTEQNSYLKKVKSLMETERQLRTNLFNLQVEYIKNQYGEKRIKAQIMRKSLSKSAEGRGILKMLEDATKIRVIG